MQDEFNSAYSHPEFLLQQRVADVMLNVSRLFLLLSFGPGGKREMSKD